MPMDGVAGIYSPDIDNTLVEKIFLATGANQHRGKLVTGIATGNGKGIYIYKGLGRVGDVINLGSDVMRAFSDLEPTAAIGNVGYTKNPMPEEMNAEPIRICPKSHSNIEVVLTMDGYLVRENDLKAELEGSYKFLTSNKTEVIGALLHKYITEEGISFEAGRKLVDKLHGRATFSLVALVYNGRQTRMITLNDDRAFEPFCYGSVDGAFVASSESCSQKRLGGSFEREYDGAEMTICSSNGVEMKRLRNEILLPDIFQAIYFGHVSSFFRGKEILQIRRQLGLELVKYYGNSIADIVIPNPNSGWGVSVGIAEGLGKDLLPALVINPQAVRTFQEGVNRTAEVGLKFSGIESLLYGKNIAMGDDSIVRGSVSEGGSVWVLHNCGAKYIEFWISYGGMYFPSFKGWHNGISSLNELALQRAFKRDNPYNKSPDEINRAVAKLVGVDEVRYNTKKIIEKVAGKGSFQAMDASYPISKRFWPDWLKREVDKFNKSR